MTDDRIVELQAHTEYSDGSSLDDVLGAAQTRGLSAVAITDHHEVAGISEAIKKVEKNNLGIEIVPGVEFSTREGPHILGLLIDYQDASLINVLKEIQISRRTVCLERLEKFKKFSPLFSSELELVSEDLIALTPGGNLSGSHFELLIYNKVSRLYTHDREEYKKVMTTLTSQLRAQQNRAIDFDSEADFHQSYGLPYISNLVRNYLMRSEQPCHVKMDYSLTVSATIGFIQDMGGLAIWAHAGKPDYGDSMIETMLTAKIDGIDAFSPKHTAEQNQQFAHVCRQHGLVTVMSSDYHGRYTPHLTIGQVDGVDIPYSILDELREVKEKRPNLQYHNPKRLGTLNTSDPDKNP